METIGVWIMLLGGAAVFVFGVKVAVYGMGNYLLSSPDESIFGMGHWELLFAAALIIVGFAVLDGALYVLETKCLWPLTGC
jgi:hypothetical protein